jgi:FAD/FMN-containing dehydrogenase
MTDDTLPGSLREALAQSGLAHCLDDHEETLALLSTDLVMTAAHRPVARLRPRSRDELAGLLQACARVGAAVEVRGAGLSYSGGYLAQTPGTVVLDLSALCELGFHPGSRRVAVVESGVTWQALDAWLSGTGLRPSLSAPISGSVSTIGASIRQGMPVDMSGVLAVEVVTPQGEVLRTGALATDSDFSPLWRGQGPDLTGLFIGDCGAYGVLTRVWLRLDPEPARRAFFSCALPQAEDFPRLLDALAEVGVMHRAYAFDPARTQAMRAQPQREQLAVAWRVLCSAKGIGPRLRSAADLLHTATGSSRGDPGAAWGAHLILEADEVQTLHAGLRSAQRFMRAAGGRALATTVAEAMATRPYSVRGALGPAYERWAPVSAVFDRSRLRGVLSSVEAALEAARASERVPGLQTSLLMLGLGTDHLVLEPMLLWPSTLYPLHAHLVPRADGIAVEDADARDGAALEIRRELAGLLDELGGQHVQLGRFYAYRERLDTRTWDLMGALKTALDPDSRLAPGTLGLGLRGDG